MKQVFRLPHSSRCRRQRVKKRKKQASCSDICVQSRLAPIIQKSRGTERKSVISKIKTGEERVTPKLLSRQQPHKRKSERCRFRRKQGKYWERERQPIIIKTIQSSFYVLFEFLYYFCSLNVSVSGCEIKYIYSLNGYYYRIILQT